MKIAIVGLGLIGGSLGMALKRRDSQHNTEIIGIDLSEDIIRQAVEMRAIDRGTCDLAAGVADADVVFVATLLSRTVPVVVEMLPHLKSGAIISDVGSTKENIAREIGQAISTARRPDVIYIGGHPMAGSEKSGITAADPYLFENAVYVILREPGEEGLGAENEDEVEQARQVVMSLVERTGARLLLLDAREHDRMVAAISHLPHLLAGVLVNAVGEVEEEYPEVFKLAAGGFRDVTRIADSQPALWRDIFYGNKASLRYVLDLYKTQLTKIEKVLEGEDRSEMMRLLEQARQLRSQVPKKVKGLLPTLSEIVVTIPDKPGEIGKVANILGAKDINIVDIEILRVREGDGGTLRLGFTNPEERSRGIEVLHFFGYVTKNI